MNSVLLFAAAAASTAGPSGSATLIGPGGAAAACG